MYQIEQLVQFMLEHDASDLYLTVGRAPSYKISGLVKNAGKEIVTEEIITSLYQDVMDQEQQAEFEERKEYNLGRTFPDIEGRFRFNMYYQKSSPAMVVRKIETKIKSIDDLELPAILKDLAMTKRGLVLVSGATGVGKSTTLASMIDHRNTNEAGHIITIEDPVEFVHEHKNCVISQREVGVDTDTYSDALKNALRQAPTVILVGEIRDENTMAHAINFAETGHLCLATIHSNNANQAMERILNFFPAQRHRQIYMQLSLNLKAIISQRLVTTKDGKRTAAVELLTDSARVRDLIKKGEIDSLKEAMITGANEGMQTFDQALIVLYDSGRISKEEALAHADNSTDMKIQLKLARG